MSVINAMATVTAHKIPKSLTEGVALEAIIKKPPTNAIVVEKSALPV